MLPAGAAAAAHIKRRYSLSATRDQLRVLYKTEVIASSQIKLPMVNYGRPSAHFSPLVTWRIQLGYRAPSSSCCRHRPTTRVSAKSQILWERILSGPANPQTAHQGAALFV